MLEDSSFILLKNIPSNYGLLQSKNLIKQTLNDDNAVISIEYGKTIDGKVSRSSMNVQLRNSSYVDDLLKTPFMEVEHELKLHRIVVTKPRSMSSGQVPLFKNQHDPIPTCSGLDAPESVFTQQPRSVFCTRVPPDMYNGRDLRYHFSRFGYVDKVYLPPNNKTYAIVRFRDPMSASEAIRLGGRMNGRRDRMLVKPDRDESKK